MNQEMESSIIHQKPRRKKIHTYKQNPDGEKKMKATQKIEKKNGGNQDQIIFS
jgi:hypothetical protein